MQKDNKSISIKKNNNLINRGIDDYISNRQIFLKKIQPLLKENQDFFVIKNKKSLAKGGAEKLAHIFGLRAKFIVDKDTMALLNDIKRLIIFICELYDKRGQYVGQGRGACSLDEKQNNPNTAIKIAQKRAYVDAIIRATGLSDIFTQDLEDIEENGNGPEERKIKEEKPLTDKQKAYLLKLFELKGKIPAEREAIIKKYKPSIDLLTSQEASQIIEQLQKEPNAEVSTIWIRE